MNRGEKTLPQLQRAGFKKIKRNKNFAQQFYVKTVDKKKINVFLIQQLIVDGINGKMKCR